MSANNILLRCHKLGTVHTQPQSKEDRESGKLGKTLISYLREIHREIVTGRKREYSSKYTEKGLFCEQDAITLLSRVKGVFLKKNTERLSNEFITGEPDIFQGPEIRKAKHGHDTKCSWDLWSFPYPDETVTKDYYWQAQGYMDLTGADTWSIDHCLVNAPAPLITKEKESLWYKMDCPDTNNPLYKEKCMEIEKNLIFDMGDFQKQNPNYDLDCKDWSFDIPREERIVSYVIERDDNAVRSTHEKVKQCREWMNENLFKVSPLIQKAQ